MKIVKRIALVVVIFTPVALAGLTDTVAFLLFIPGLLLAFVPASILLVASIVLFVPVIRLYREGRVVRTTFLALVALQSIILIFWLEGWTAAILRQTWKSIPANIAKTSFPAIDDLQVQP